MSSLNEEDWNLLQEYCNENLSDEEILKFDQRLKESAEFRKEFRHLSAMDSYIRDSQGQLIPYEEPNQKNRSNKVKLLYWFLGGVAATLMIAISYLTIITEDDDLYIKSTSQNMELQFAVIENLNQVNWKEGKHVFKIGDTIGAEKIQFNKGWIQLEFYSGATVLVEGPSQLEIVSAWELICKRGKLIAQVPAAARGFLVRSEDTKVVDLGTEFGFEVTDKGSKVQVFAGEVEIDTADQNKLKLFQGQALQVSSGKSETMAHELKSKEFINQVTLNQKQEKLKARYQNWKSAQATWVNDSRLTAYFPFNVAEQNGIVNHSTIENEQLKGKLIQGHYVPGRWFRQESYGALNFSKSASRVRVHIPEKFESMTFSCWVRIFQLGNRWNSLFLSDSFEYGEPHWQISEKGELTFCVSVSSNLMADIKNKKPYTYLYRSPKIFNHKNSGRWLHVATVYDKQNHKVIHYLNGDKVSEENIHEKLTTENIVIGNAEIGNWSQPTQHSPYFAMRNLHGDIDDFMLFSEALDPKTVKQLFNDSKNY